MSKRIFKNANVLCPDIGFKLTDLTVESGIIVSAEKTELSGEDCTDKYIIPGLIDIHTHGCMGHDFSDTDAQGISDICRTMAKNGTTTILAAVMTQSEDKMLAAAKEIVSHTHADGLSRIAGIYMEGPFFSQEHRGAQHPMYIREVSQEFISKMQEASQGKLKILSLAPEKPGALDLIEDLQDIKVFLGHTDSDFETARAAFNAGAVGLTHSFNCMRPLHHREPGALGAAIGDGRIICECICDGLHVHPAMVKLLYDQVGTERFCIVSDSIAPAFLPDGSYTSGGQKVTVKDGCARIESGALAGSSCSMLNGVKNLVSWQICSLPDAVYAATAVPAKAAGIYDSVGSIKTGKKADLLILDKNLDLIETVVS